MMVPDLHLEYQEVFEEFFISMLEVRNAARGQLYEKKLEEYEDFLRYGNFDLYGLTAASDDAEVYGWCLELWGLECHCPIPCSEYPDYPCPICDKPQSETIKGDQLWGPEDQ